MLISGENAGKVIEEGKFSCAVCAKSVDSNSIFLPVLQVLCIRDVVVLGKLKEDGKFKCVKQQRGKGEHFQGIELNGQSLEIVEKFFLSWCCNSS